MTKYYDFKENINEKELDEIIKILNNDGVIIFPTETVYGIGGNALSEDVIKRIYMVKNRPIDKHVNIMVGSTLDIEKYASISYKLEKEMIEKYMPGAITIILEKKEILNNKYFDSKTIGIRIPDHRIALEILNKITFPIVATSANISGNEVLTNIDEIKAIFDGKVDAIIDGGKINNLASTIIKIENNEINILRQGTLKIER